jgi:hypothetical protein
MLLLSNCKIVTKLRYAKKGLGDNLLSAKPSDSLYKERNNGIASLKHMMNFPTQAKSTLRKWRIKYGLC